MLSFLFLGLALNYGVFVGFPALQVIFRNQHRQVWSLFDWIEKVGEKFKDIIYVWTVIFSAQE